MGVFEDAGSGVIYYAVSTDDKTTWSVIDNVNGVRDIARNNVGTWQYNSNATYGSETWTNATTNTELQALKDSMLITVNQMDKTQLEAVADSNHFTLGDYLDLAIILKWNGEPLPVSVPYSQGVTINYDANVLNEVAVQGTDYDFDYPETTKVRVTALTAGNYKVRIV
jgi:hypothetical protein